MNAPQLKDKFISFFQTKGHREIPSSSLVPENDPTTLFISAGMHPLVPFLLGQPHPQGKRLVNVQRCVRTGDIDEVGDAIHHTFFEMLGNWSLGDYFKQDMIKWSYEFLTEHLAIDKNYLAFTVFAGDPDAPKDQESADTWLSLGVSDKRLAFLPKKNNWWGPAGQTGPCGPDTEMFYWTGTETPPSAFDPDDSRWVEIWNDVFMQYRKTENGDFQPLSQKNVDTGMGVERTIAVLNGLDDNYLSPIWLPIIKKIEDVSNIRYQDNPKPMRIIADHLRSSVFIIADGVEPANKEAGYVLRRLIRRAVRQFKLLGISQPISIIASTIIDNHHHLAGNYQYLEDKKDLILEILHTEEQKFLKTLDSGLREIEKLIASKKVISGIDAFNLYQSFGFPFEMIKEELEKNHIILNEAEFNQAKEKHQQQSRTLSAGKFQSGLADNSEIVTKYHTATHLLHAALRQILGPHVQQSGSNITPQRLRFDFSHPSKLSQDEIEKIQDLVNQIILQKIPVTSSQMTYSQAIKKGALAFFGSKYPQVVSVYQVGDFSKEVCTGPHVANTSSLGSFKITKEESAGSGKRRIYAQLA